MRTTRRQFLHTAVATAGAVTLLPYAARAASHTGDLFESNIGYIGVHPISHASFVMESAAGVIYVDPVGEPAAYADFPAPDLILVTHRHGDHYNAETLAALVGDGTEIVTNQDVYDMMPADLQARSGTLPTGDATMFGDVEVGTIPAYNTTEGRLDFHPKARGDLGFVLTIGDFRIYISGDTEDTPEMRALENIDLAFVCMVVPFTMDAAAAASAVSEFKPTYVYPYHYVPSRDGGQDPEDFAAMVGEEIEVKFGSWYG